jgi:diadenosine tetraphosphate (Ap4A) HIT family hydrolase
MAQGQPAMSASPCKACHGSWPKEDHFIADLGLSKAYLHDDQFFPGWTVVVLKHHAIELFHLAHTERVQLMEEVNLVAKALSQVYEAKKINYELLGNQLPHIHWHVIPRLANDPASVAGNPLSGIPVNRATTSLCRTHQATAFLDRCPPQQKSCHHPCTPNCNLIDHCQKCLQYGRNCFRIDLYGILLSTLRSTADLV